MRVGLEASRIALLLGTAGLAWAAAANAATIVVASGTTDTAAKTVSGTDTLTVQPTGALSVNGTAVTWNNASTALVIINSGTIQSTASGGRAINASGSNNNRTITLTNNVGGVITSQDDAFRINVNPTGGTITVNNYGSIRTSNGGQALDFDAAGSGSATILINNYAGAELRSFGQDAIRPGQGAVVTNAGTIYADGTPNNSYDGVDFQANSGTVVNQTGGLISGLRHGITSNTGLDVTNQAGGTITGRNGSGVGSDGTGTVLNYGTITGQWDGVATNGDGDGVDIDFIGTVHNYGTIQGLSAHGVDSGGQPNSAEGIAIGGGTIINEAGATIYGGGAGILVDDGSGGSAAGATTITNAGTITGAGGAAIKLVGTFDDSITNSGTITGTGGVAIDFGAGNDQLTLMPGSVITGSVDGGAGTDTVTLGGTGSGSFAGAVNFEALNVASGSWTLTGASTFANGTSIASGANLTGSAAVLTGAIADSGTLTVDQPTDATFGVALTGTGTLVKAGAGALTIGSQPGFTGATLVNAGRLRLAGTLTSAVTVASGATLAGNGTVASATIQSGGTIAPGNSIGTIMIAGNFVQATGSTYAAEIAADGTSDRIAVGGTATIQNGTTLAITRLPGTYAIGTRYTLITAAGGITGNYTNVTQSSADGTELRIATGVNGALAIDVARSAAGLTTIAQTPNQMGVAAALGTLGTANAAYAALTMIPGADATRDALNALSGEVHASTRTALVRDAGTAQQAVMGHILDANSQRGLWTQMMVGGGQDDGAFGGSDGNRDLFGGLIGLDWGLGDATRVGLAGGYTRDRLRVPASRAKLETIHLLAYAATAMGNVRLRGGVGYGWTDVKSNRTVAFGSFSDNLSAKYDADTLHGFADIGYALPAMGGTVEPFAAIAAYRYHTDGFAEAGGASALSGQSGHDSYAQSQLGLRVATPITGAISARGSLSWQHMFGDIAPTATLAFGASPATFTVVGTGLPKDAAALSMGISWAASDAVRLTVGYDGQIGQGSDNAGRATLSIGF